MPGNVLAQWNGPALPDDVVGTGIVLDEADGYPTPPSMLVDDPTAGVAYAEFGLPPAPEVSVRFYFRTPTAFAATAEVIATLIAAAAVASLQITGTGQPGGVRLLRAGGAQVAASPNITIATDQWYRLELQVDTVNTRARAGVFLPDAPTPVWPASGDGWQTHADFSTIPAALRLGATSSGTDSLGLRFSEVLVTDDVSDWVGPVPAGPAIGPRVNRWVGGQKVPLRASRWVGGQKVPQKATRS